MSTSRVRLQPRASWAVSLLFLCLVIADVALAQSGWDPAEYSSLLSEGEQLFEAASEVPEWDRERRRELLVQSAAAKQRALDMLYAGLLIDQIEMSQELAIRDFFNLNQNVIAILLIVGECTAAEFLLERTLADTRFLPEEGVAYLREMRSSIEECRIGLTVSDWGQTTYEELLTRAEATANSHVTVRLWQDAQAILTHALTHGLITAEGRSQYVGEMSALLERIVGTLVDLDECDAASRELRRAEERTALLPEDSESLLRALRNSVQDCRERVAAAPTAELVPPIVVDSGPNPIGVAFLGAAGATALAAIIYDVTLSDERSLLEDLRDDCGDGYCNIEMAREVAETIDEGKVVLAVLTGIAVATGVTGLVLLLTGDDEGEPETVVSPLISPHFSGAMLEVRY